MGKINTKVYSQYFQEYLEDALKNAELTSCGLSVYLREKRLYAKGPSMFSRHYIEKSCASLDLINHFDKCCLWEWPLSKALDEIEAAYRMRLLTGDSRDW